MTDSPVSNSPRGIPQARPLASSARVNASGIGRRLWTDRLVRSLVTVGGFTIIGTILAILFVFLAVVFPLFKTPKAIQESSFPVSAPGPGAEILAAGADEHRQVAYIVDATGIRFFSMAGKKPLPPQTIPDLSGAKITGIGKSKEDFLALGLSDGRVIPVRIRFDVSFTEGVRRVEPSLEIKPALAISPDGLPIFKLGFYSGENGYRVAVAASGEITLVIVSERKTLMGATKTEESRKHIALPAGEKVTALMLDKGGENLYVGAASGLLFKTALGEAGEEAAKFETLNEKEKNSSITSLGFLLDGQTLVVGDETGHVTSHQSVKEGGGYASFLKIHSFKAHEKPVTVFDSSRRDKGFITGDSGGTVHYHYGTSGKTLFSVPLAGRQGLSAAALAPKTDGLIAIDAAGGMSHWNIDNPHPEVSWSTLFAPVVYEGSATPEYVWQSTGGSDEFEAKFSLMPLIYGTLKGTFYALLFAVPLALFSALYTSQFMHPSYKSVVKPVIEIMAALPSVVLGFFAALWLAPNVEKFLPGLVFSPFIIAALVALYLFGTQRYPGMFRTGRKAGSEIVILIILAFAGGGIAFSLGGAFESAWLGGDYRTWMNQAFGLSYDQRNSLVVGLAMGFAVIPIIFTIAEDSLANVPFHLTAGSLALGATSWQTAINVVLPTASPGIFSAIMIGFGRAVGETMIVLMATGNTPVMNWNIFSGFRALSANIAVELPEAPEGGSLFRILFLAALLLFFMTFLVNSLAEWIRLRLRERYRVL